MRYRVDDQCVALGECVPNVAPNAHQYVDARVPNRHDDDRNGVDEHRNDVDNGRLRS